MVKITVNGRELEAEEGSPVLVALRENGIGIPTLCYHPALKPSGSCKLCTVEVKGKTGRQTTMLSCILRARDGLEVETESELVAKARQRAFKDLLQMAPQSQAVRNLAREYGIDLAPPPDGCIRCRLCIRVCKEIVGAGALKMEKREEQNYVFPAEGLCIGCGTCANICPTSTIRLEDHDAVRTISIRDEVIGRHVLERCEACKRLYATQKFLLHVTERTSMHPDVKEHHAYCPTCAKLFSARVKSASKIRRL
jgi:bidirectional [NiFe] hydrogenase diaphorase subunit